METLEAATKLSQSWLHEVDVKEEEEDMDHEHLVVVGGWREQGREALFPCLIFPFAGY